jgi:hypothetical protein
LKEDKNMNNKTKAWIILALSGICLIGGLWLLLQAYPLQTEHEPEITYISPAVAMTAIPTPTPAETPNTTTTANITATATPTRRVTTGWHQGGGGGSSGRSTPAAPIPELPTAGLMGAGLLVLYWKRRE